ncbi:MAG: hypothetical protein II513_04315 [Ruminococcus sp.]|nr:hypothetical protein [Ruminococcus sp.]
MDKELTIEKVIEHLKAEYERAKKKSFVAKPMAYALYSVWRAVDFTEKRRTLPHVGGSDDEK